MSPGFPQPSGWVEPVGSAVEVEGVDARVVLRGQRLAGAEARGAHHLACPRALRAALAGLHRPRADALPARQVAGALRAGRGRGADRGGVGPGSAGRASGVCVYVWVGGWGPLIIYRLGEALPPLSQPPCAAARQHPPLQQRSCPTCSTCSASLPQAPAPLPCALLGPLPPRSRCITSCPKHPPSKPTTPTPTTRHTHSKGCQARLMPTSQ